jgi:microcystin-dependent protein
MRPLVNPSLTDEVKTYVTNYINRVGTYIHSHTQPSGTLPVNQSVFNIADYPALYAKLGPSGANVLGPGNGAGTFSTEDVRGRVARYTDDGAGVDPDASSRSAMFTGTASGDAPGSIQGDRNASHHHFAFNDSAATGSSTALSSTATPHKFNGLTYSAGIYRYEMLGTTSAADVGKTSSQGGADARMKNWGTRLWVYYE